MSERDSFQEWERISRVLGCVETNAQWLTVYAAKIEFALNLLPAAPDFETNAAAELDKAEKQIATTLALVRSVKERYAAKPVHQTKMAAE